MLFRSVRFVFELRKWVRPELMNSDGAKNLYGFVKTACREHLRVEIKKNHGVKQYNLKQLARYLGITWDAFENANTFQVVQLNTLGSKRGEAGHLSPFSDKNEGLTEDIGPDQVREWVGDGVSAVKGIKIYLELLTKATV